jgi:hypothetical protein
VPERSSSRLVMAYRGGASEPRISGTSHKITKDNNRGHFPGNVRSRTLPDMTPLILRVDRNGVPNPSDVATIVATVDENLRPYVPQDLANMAVAAKNFRPYDPVTRVPVEEYRSHYRNRKWYVDDILMIVRYWPFFLCSLHLRQSISRLPLIGTRIQRTLAGALDPNLYNDVCKLLNITLRKP